MSTELIGILAVGATLLLVQFGVWRTVRTENADLRKDFSDLRKSLSDLGERVARIEGVLFHGIPLERTEK